MLLEFVEGLGHDYEYLLEGRDGLTQIHSQCFLREHKIDSANKDSEDEVDKVHTNVHHLTRGDLFSQLDQSDCIKLMEYIEKAINQLIKSADRVVLR